ncbi:SpoIIE family protein phosphatase [Streptomyces showdoensis]|uniref:protein-serine/threonine phosphatase n=1 Tax=Streptomyces showdoensis TaxID=68268 RepID=A0A2P2GNW7_STREW|nr:SpoIIE family protein phosphatase [Streptomyces showdoensis]KKZ73182.1 protein kinase [Streptomyces showdoensis]
MSDALLPDDGLPPFTEDGAAALIDSRGRIDGWTPEAGALLGRSAAAVVGTSARSLLAEPAAWPGLVAAYARGARRGDAVLRTGQGAELPVVFQAFDLAGDREPAGCLVLATPAARAVRRHQDRAFVRELFLQDRVGLAVFDAGLRLLRTNTHLLPYTGVPADLRGRRLGDFLWPGDADAIEEKLRQVLRTGTPLMGVEEVLRTLDDPRGGVIISISAFRLQSPDGQVLGLTALFTDVTELRRSTERLALLHRATASVGRSLSVTDTGRELAAALVPGLGDLAVVELADGVVYGEEPVPDREGRLLLRRTAVAGRLADASGDDGEVPGDDGESGTEGPDGPEARGGGGEGGIGARSDGGIGARSDGGGPRTPAGAGNPADPGAVLAVVPADGGAGTGPAVDAPAVGGYPLTMTAPLRARGMVLGRVSVGRHADRGPYQAPDQDLLREIAGRAGLALDNARRFTREHRAAVGLQRSMLPPTQSETPAASTSAVYLPAGTATGVGGDWFDVIPLSSARVALVVGDVVGHGLAATATMGRLRTAVRTLADLDLEPDELMAHLDDLVSQLAAYPEEPGDAADEGEPDDDGWRDRHATSPTGATCVYAIYDPISRRCAVASAGHPPPVVADPAGKVTYLPVDPGPPLGVGGLPFETTEVDLAPGSVLALYTDGLIEGRDGDMDVGMAELAARLARPAALAGPLRELGREIVTGRPVVGLADDVTLLLARTRTVPPEDAAAWPVEADPAAVGRVREAAAAQLRAWDLDELVFTTELVLSELVTNAIRYAGGPVEVRLIRAGRLVCEVSDPSATHPRMRRAQLTDEGGRGLYLVAQLTTRWGSRYSRRGKTIWAEQELPR